MEETKIPLEQRFLIITGIAESNICEKFFGEEYPLGSENILCCFISFAYADLPIGKSFNTAFTRSKPNQNFNTLIEIKAVTQQFGDKLTSVPYGWKTICILYFPQGIPQAIRKLPTVKDWYESDIEDHICITDEKSLTAILTK